MGSFTKPKTKEKITNILKQYNKLPAMCDRILFCLHKVINPKLFIYFDEFNVWDDLKNSRHKLVYAYFSVYTTNVLRTRPYL